MQPVWCIGSKPIKIITYSLITMPLLTVLLTVLFNSIMIINILNI
ncbi:MAG: hypothetical protein RI956_983 [Pseudomonadota bacterium]|jgi:hypothetical protein